MKRKRSKAAVSLKMKKTQYHGSQSFYDRSSVTLRQDALDIASRRDVFLVGSQTLNFDNLIYRGEQAMSFMVQVNSTMLIKTGRVPKASG